MGKKEEYCKLSNAKVLGMRSLYRDGYTKAELARIYGVSRSYVTKLVNEEFRKDIAI